MNCRTFRHSLPDLLESLATRSPKEILRHLEACPECARELRESRAAMEALRPSQALRATSTFKEKTMSKIADIEIEEQAVAIRPARRSWRLTIVVAAAAALGLAVLGVNTMLTRSGKPPLTAFGALAQAAEAMSGMRTAHIKTRMRTLPADNFDMIVPEGDFVPVEIWSRMEKPAQWRIEKPERVIAMDGRASVMMIKKDPPMAAKGGVGTGMVVWLRPLLDVNTLFDLEQKTAREAGADLRITHRTDPGGVEKIVLTIVAKAQGDFSQSDYAKNKSVVESDNMRVYLFDAKTLLLENMQVYVRVKGADVLVFEIENIEYNTPLDASLFTLSVPENATWLGAPEREPVTVDTSAMTPKEAAQAFFQAMADKNWEAGRPFFGSHVDRGDVRNHLGGLTIISLGKPFQSGLYGGWFVPYEIKFADGRVQKHNLAVRNDNPQRQWKVDGGI